MCVCVFFFSKSIRLILVVTTFSLRTAAIRVRRYKEDFKSRKNRGAVKRQERKRREQRDRESREKKEERKEKQKTRQ